MKADIRAALEAQLAERLLVLDGAMVTMIQRHHLTEAEFRGERWRQHSHDLQGDNDVLVITRPNVISAKAGIPLELDFKGPASGCNGTVVSQQLGFKQDVSNGGTIKVDALQPGTYTFTCGMGMYVARIVVQ